MSSTVLDNPILDSPTISPNSTYYRVKSGKVKSIATADDSLIIAEPSSTAMSDSQYCKTTITSCGHVLEEDSTPNAERLSIFHKDGHFIELSKNGQVTKVFGKDFEIILDDKTLSVAGKLNITVQGDANLLIAGNATTKIQGNEEKFIMGDSVTYIKGNYTIKSEKTLQLESTTNITTKSRGTTTLFSSGAFDIISNTSLTLISENSSISLGGGGVANLNVSSYTVSASGNIILQANGNISTLSNSNISTVAAGSISGGELAPPPANVSPPLTSLIPTSQNIKFGLGFSTSLMEPSATEMFLNKAESASALFLQDASITYPKNRVIV